MKNVKKLLSIVMVLTLVLSLGASALAVDITIDNAAEGTEYSAYQLLTAKFNRTQEDGKDIYEYHINETFADAVWAGIDAITLADGQVKPVKGETVENDVVKFLGSLTADQTRQFADAAYRAIQDKGLAATKTSSGKSIEDLEQGYYLVAETNANGGATSKVMLDTAGKENIGIVTKEDVPTSEKKVKDINDSNEDGETGWQDSADYDIGDEVPFQLKGTLPADYASYKSYTVTFHDTQSAGLDAPKAIDSVQVNGVDADYTFTTSETGDGCTFHVTIDVKAAAPAAKAGDEIIVTYKSVLNKEAEIGSKGNPNEMYMEYSNNPYGEGTGTTPKDTVIVFTYELDVDKIDANKEPLEGAGFTLYKWDPDAKDAEGEPLKDKWVAVGEEITEVTTFVFKGLDDGKYKLVETTVPDGYNKAEDIEFEVKAEHTNDADGVLQLKSLTSSNESVSVESVDDGSFSGKLLTDVTNLTGVELPSTGGIGTTIFYVVGAILVAGAVILLVSKKRASGAEK